MIFRCLREIVERQQCELRRQACFDEIVSCFEQSFCAIENFKQTELCTIKQCVVAIYLRQQCLERTFQAEIAGVQGEFIRSAQFGMMKSQAANNELSILAVW